MTAGSPPSPHQRRNDLARRRGFSSYRQQRQASNIVRNRGDLANLPASAQRTRQQALDAVALARRERVDLAVAAEREGTTLDAVTYWAPSAIERSGKTWNVQSADRLFRPMYVYSAGAPVAVDVRGSRTATKIGRYHAAVQRYLNTGDASRLAKFRGVRVGGVELEADLDVLDELARRGAFDFESIYRMVG